MNAHVVSDRQVAGLLPAAGERRGTNFLTAPFVAAYYWLMEAQRRAIVLRELGMLTDRELADIGLTRNDLPSVFNAEAMADRNEGRA